MLMVYMMSHKENSRNLRRTTLSDETDKEIPPAAQRALAEAEERRRMSAQEERTAPREINGRDGPDPARYGDWEKKGIAVDF